LAPANNEHVTVLHNFLYVLPLPTVGELYANLQDDAWLVGGLGD